MNLSYTPTSNMMPRNSQLYAKERIISSTKLNHNQNSMIMNQINENKQQQEEE